MQHFDYEWEHQKASSQPKKYITNWQSDFGPKVIQRNEDKTAKLVQFNLLIDNPFLKVYIIGSFNNWEQNEKNLENYRLKLDEHSIFASITLDNIKHKDEYKFLVLDGNKKQLIEDPAATFFSDFGNSIFWDYEDPSSYKQKYQLINNFERSTKIMQTDLPGLIVHFADKDGILGQNVKENQFYKFITESGVIKKIKELGFNTIQFLPFAQSIDGSNWKFRYLVPFQFAIQKNWGTPNEFAQMIDEFHKNGIAVIGDFVLGHLPDRNFSVFGQSSDEHGLHLWKKRDGSFLYMKDETSWGTRRIEFDNPHVRDFFTSSVIHFLKYYKIDGFRIDNVDGIIRYGDNGDGDERPNGRTFLRQINQTIYDYNPSALINYEAHYYYGDNAKMLVAPLQSDSRALGATTYNSSRLTYFFHTDLMFKAMDEVSVWKFKHINDEMEWGKSNSTIADFHNHDAAAGLMVNRCTGAYAYDCMMEGSSANHIHAVGKIKVMEAAISFFCEGRTLDLLQTFLLQPGTFEHDSSVWWHLTFNEANNNLVNFKSKVNHIMDNPAFWPENVNNREFLNLDDVNKVVVMKRESDNSKYIIVINFSAFKYLKYKVGVKGQKDYEVVLNSDEFKYSGMGMASYPPKLKNNPSTNFEVLDREVELQVLAPYGVVVLKEIN